MDIGTLLYGKLNFNAYKDCYLIEHFFVGDNSFLWLRRTGFKLLDFHKNRKTKTKNVIK